MSKAWKKSFLPSLRSLRGLSAVGVASDAKDIVRTRPRGPCSPGAYGESGEPKVGQTGTNTSGCMWSCSGGEVGVPSAYVTGGPSRVEVGGGQKSLS